MAAPSTCSPEVVSSKTPAPTPHPSQFAKSVYFLSSAQAPRCPCLQPLHALWAACPEQPGKAADTPQIPFDHSTPNTYWFPQAACEHPEGQDGVLFTPRSSAFHRVGPGQTLGECLSEHGISLLFAQLLPREALALGWTELPRFPCGAGVGGGGVVKIRLLGEKFYPGLS